MTGELAQLRLNGTQCELCGVELGEAVGYPRQCRACTLGGPEHRLQCPRCGWTGYPILTRKVIPKGFHVGAYCRQCAGWIKWLKQDRTVLEELRRQEKEDSP